jgi:cellulose synthase/poly-beta-1,6-N-acetylglucosamine synthase-like glycosyltransferase
MEGLFLGVGILFLGLAIHPFVTYPLSLLLIKKLQRRDVTEPRSDDADAPLDFAICMCAYNEEGVIRQKIENLLALRAQTPGLEIFIYVDAATDRTAEYLEAYAQQFHVHVAKERHGKTYGMNLLAAKASASILVFTDANVMLDKNCLTDLRRHFADPTIGCVCGNLTYTNGTQSVTASSGALYWKFEETVKRLEAQTGSTMGADGSLFAVRRPLHRAPPEHIIDDMYVSLMVLCEGHRVVQVTDVHAYEESATSSKEEFNRKVRIACQAFNVHRLIWPRIRRLPLLDQYKYISHKLLRWLSIYFLALSGLAFGAALLASGAAHIAMVLLLLGLGASALGYFWQLKPFAQALDLLVALSGAGLGVWRSVRGERYQTWSPAASIRRT